MGRLMVNEKVTVMQIGFKKNLVVYPKRIEFRGIVYDFLDAGLRCSVRTGNHVSEIITMTDGQRQFRIRSDNYGGSWVLVSIVS